MRMWGPQSFLGPHLPALLPYFYLSLPYFPLSRITFLFCSVITIVSLGEILKINANEQHLHDEGFVNIIPVRPEWDASITLLSLWSNARTLHTPTQVTMGIPQRYCRCSVQFSSVQSLSHVQLFATPWIAACQASLSITNSRSLLKLISIELVMPSRHLILCRPLLLLPPIPPSIRVFSKESTLRMRWPKYWSFSFSISPSSEYPELITFRCSSRITP